MSNPFRMVSKLTRRLVSREAPRADKSSENERSSTNAQLIFETFEPRLLLAADPLGIAAAALDSTAPTVSLTPPAPIVSGTVNLAATASDDVGVVGVKFLLDGNTTIGAEDTKSPYGVSWNTTTVANGTHTLAAQARDAANNVATSTARTVTVDNQAPTGTVVINGGAAATNSRTVTLMLSATDAVTSVTQMRFSNNGTSFSAAEAFAPTKTWTLSSGAGAKTVYAQFRDAAGNWSAAATDTIVLDTTAPTISGRTATNITASSAQITWTTNEPATSRVEYGLTTAYGSSTTLDPTLVTAHSVALTGLAPNTTYNYRVRSIDAAGNELVSANSTFRTAAAADTVPPSTPTGLSRALFRQRRSISRGTPRPTMSAVTGYQILRNGTQVGTSTTTTFSNTGLSPNTALQLHRAGSRCRRQRLRRRPPRPAPRRSRWTRRRPAVAITAPTGYCAAFGDDHHQRQRLRRRRRGGRDLPGRQRRGRRGEDTTSPYSVSWDTTAVPNGIHTIVARARDTSNNSDGFRCR